MKTTPYDFSGINDRLEQFRYEVTNNWNYGKYPFPIVTASTPTWDAQPGETVLYYPSTGGFAMYIYNNSAWSRMVSSGTSTQIYPLAINSGGTSATTVGGLYQPGSASVANLDAISLSSAQYMILGSTVTVSGRFTADPTAPATQTIFGITLPVASAMVASDNLAGVAFCGNIAGQGAEVCADQTNDRAQVFWVSGDVTSQSWSYTYLYQIK